MFLNFILILFLNRTYAADQNFIIKNSVISPTCGKFLENLKTCQAASCNSSRLENGVQKKYQFDILRSSPGNICEVNLATEAATLNCNLTAAQRESLKQHLAETFKAPDFQFTSTDCSKKVNGCLIILNKKKFLNVMRIAAGKNQCVKTDKKK